MRVIEQLRALDEGRFLSIYESLAQQGYGPLDGEVAKLLRFRPQAIRKLPMEQRAKKARELMLARRNAELCYELFGTYLIKTRKELVTGFLDATGVKHEEGMISDLDHNKPDPAKVAPAVALLDREHPAEDVTLYLSVCSEQWPEIREIEELWRGRME